VNEQVPHVAPERQAAERGGIRRVLTRWDLVLYGLTILTPTAPYPVYGIIQQASHGHAALSYLVAMIAMMFTAASYAKMAAAYPSAGSTYTYVQQTLSPYVGFLESIIYSAITAARLAPAVPYVIWVVIFTAGIMIINVRGIRIMARANVAMMAVMISSALIFIGLAARYIVVQYGMNGLFSTSGLFRPETFQIRPMMLGAAIATLSYIGFDAISTLSEDAVQPKRDIGFSTVLVCILQTVICVVTVYLASLSWPDYRSFPQSETAILDLGQRIGGQALFVLLTFVLLVAGIASALTGQAGASRLLFAMGRDGVISRRSFAYLHPRYATPARAIYIVFIVSLAGALTMRFQIAIELLNFGAFAGFVLVNLSVIQHYFIRLKQRSGRAILFNLLFPLLGALVCSYVWMNLSTKAKIAGFVWLAIGGIYLTLLTRGFKKAPKELSFGEFQ
jgi:putrescine importer